MNRQRETDEDDDEAGDSGSTAELRIDRWLWCARFFKSRSLAAQAVGAGRVRIGDQRLKASRLVKPGDVLELILGGRELTLEVLALPARRGPADEARACYRETAESEARGRQLGEQQRLAALTVPRPERRPDKKARRELLQLARRQGRA